MLDAPHDKLFRQTFSDVIQVRAELRSVLPPELFQQINLETLVERPTLTIGKDLSARHCDIVYEALIADSPGYIYLLLEHQSTVDPLMPFRILEYVVRLIRKSLDSNEHARDDYLPIVIPVVVHHSDTGWTAATQVAELFSPRIAAIPEVGRFIPRLEFLLDDISHASDEELQSRANSALENLLALVLWALRDGRSTERLLGSLHRWLPILGSFLTSPDKRDACLGLLRYISAARAEITREQLEELIVAAAPGVEGEVLMTLAEQWLNEGEARGIAKGRAEGEARGIVKGEARGIAKGRAEGEARGIAKGKAEAVLALLSARGFKVSEFQRARILNEKDLSRLEQLLIKAIHAQSVSELFEE